MPCVFSQPFCFAMKCLDRETSGKGGRIRGNIEDGPFTANRYCLVSWWAGLVY